MLETNRKRYTVVDGTEKQYNQEDKRLNDSINATELEVEQILMEKIKDRDNAERYERMIEKRNREIEGFKNEIAK